MNRLEKFLEKIQGINREKDKKVFDKTGVTEVLLQIAEELRQSGDNSAIVVQEVGPHTSVTTLSLRFDLAHKDSPGRWDFSNTRWESRRVYIEPDGETVTVRWEDQLNRWPLVDHLTGAGLGGSLHAEYRELASGYRLRTLPLRDQVLLGMSFAPRVPDYRYGRASESHLVERVA